MGVNSPEDMAEAFLQRFNDRDGAGMLSLYTADAVFTMDGENFARGLDQIRAAMEPMLAAPSTIKGKYESVVLAGDLAICKLRWELLDGEGWISMDGVSLEVLKRGDDGKWRFQFDDATGSSRGRD